MVCVIILVPLDIGETVCSMTLKEPALYPDMVTRLGSPPNAAMFFCTHLRAATWSLKPLLPGTVLSPVLIKPGGRRIL